MYRKQFFCGIMCLFIYLINSQKNFAQFNTQELETISTKDGLPTNEVYHLVKDKKGFLWMATRKGLFRYDGYQFLSVGPKAFAEKISVQDDTHLLVSLSSTGIFRINTETLTSTEIVSPKWSDDNPDNDHFNNVFVDAKKRIWCGDFHHAKFFDENTKTWHLFKLFTNTAEDVTAIRIFQDAHQKVWILALNKLYFFDEKLQKPVLWQVFSKQTILRTLVEDEKKLWLGTSQNKIIEYNPITKAYIEYADGLKDAEVNDILFYKELHVQKCLVATSGGLYTFDKAIKRFTHIDKFDNIKPRFASLLLDNAHQKIWIASNEGLLKYHNGRKSYETILIPASIVPLPVTITTFLTLNQDEIFLGLSHSGVLKWNQKTGVFQKIALPYDVSVNKLTLSREGDLLVATTKGVYQLSKNASVLKAILPTVSSNIKVLCFDKNNQLWLSSEYQPIKVFSYPKLKAIQLWTDAQVNQAFWSKCLVNDMLLASDGKVWLASWYSPGFGLCYFDETKQRFTQVAALAKNLKRHNQFIGDYYLAISNRNHKIYASGYGGFNVLDNDGVILSELEIHKTKENFPDDFFAKIDVDRQGSIWVGTFDGLLRFSPDQKQFAKFIEEDGLMSNNTTNGFLIDNENQLWVGQKNGFNILKVNELIQSEIPNVFLSTCEVLGGKEIPFNGKAISLARNQNSLSLSFSPLNFSPEAKNQFRYRLVGINQDWVNNGTNNRLVFVNLQPNTYQLEVSIGTNHGVWSKKPFMMTFTIEPSFTETIWFKLLIFMLLALITYAFYRYRINQLLKIEELRTEISADLHDDVGATLSSISILSTLIQHQVKDSPTAQKYLNTILEDTASLQNKLEEIVWSLRSDRDTIGQLTARIRRIGAEIFEAKGINYAFEVDDSIGHLKLSMDFRRNLLLITKEAVNNLVKYSECKNVLISIQKVNSNLALLIKDDGKGFENTNIEGNGLRNMNARASKMNGKLTVYSIIGVGTEVKLVVSLTQIGD
ncbi:two-component regulator propeller domain-containing protein [Arcicella aquatica]|uniref:Two-component regulator propeller domain-containing protein n=1 Tax=Arcicella aquatica TaxID=217141 RepID=A0ABU5QQ36_9BACT|nr:two-component regulator propeller domain-containing protein [Arcicella aquatica]MEA5259197.1 two-component regulator propeller domain-containing protein [Arcicella aquatica]